MPLPWISIKVPFFFQADRPGPLDLSSMLIVNFVASMTLLLDGSVGAAVS